MLLVVSRRTGREDIDWVAEQLMKHGDRTVLAEGRYRQADSATQSILSMDSTVRVAAYELPETLRSRRHFARGFRIEQQANMELIAGGFAID